MNIDERKALYYLDGYKRGVFKLTEEERSLFESRVRSSDNKETNCIDQRHDVKYLDEHRAEPTRCYTCKPTVFGKLARWFHKITHYQYLDLH